MKRIAIFIFPVLSFLLTSCSTYYSVTSDYDSQADFNSYKTYAFYKKGIDEVKISGLDKKRILRAIEKSMEAKGFRKSEKPDILVNIIVKSQEKTAINPSYYYGYYGYYWYPWNYGFAGSYSDHYVEGTLFIDFIETSKKELVWQGVGRGVIPQIRAEKEDRIQRMVSEILAQYPPGRRVEKSAL